MSKQSQKEAVYTAIINVLSQEGISVKEGDNVSLSKELRSRVNNILFEGFRNGTVELTREFNDVELKAYVSGVQSNWLKKDKRLNGGVSYATKNPGSRVGSSDPSLKAMRILLNSLTLESDRIEVQAHIDQRVAELQLTKAKTVSVDYSALPADLQAKFFK